MTEAFGKLMRLCFIGAIVTTGISVAANFLQAQQPQMKEVEAERAAMRKLAFLAGHWTGPVTVSMGPGKPLPMTQSENVLSKLGGLVMLIEGKSVGGDGKAEFQALATVAYDDSTHTYRFRAYNNGHYVDAPLTVNSNGFSWGFTAGPAHVMNTMHLTTKAEWQETTEVTLGNRPPMRTVEMLLRREPQKTRSARATLSLDRGREAQNSNPG